MRMRRSFNFQESDRCRARKLDREAWGGELLTALSRRGQGGSFVQNGEHSFCSKRRHGEEKSFNGRRPLFSPSKTSSFVQARSGRIISVQNGEHSFCSKRRHDEEKHRDPSMYTAYGPRGRY